MPVIGLVQVGDQDRADRYMSLPMVGLIWIAVLVGGGGLGRMGPPGGAILSWVYPCFGWAVAGSSRTGRYLVGRTLFFWLPTRSIQWGPCYVWRRCSGGYFDNGNPAQALPLFESLAYRSNPTLRDVVAYAQVLHGVARLREANDVCRQVVAYDARGYYAHAYLSVWLLEGGAPAQAAEHAERMRAIGPPYGHVPFFSEVARQNSARLFRSR